MQLILLKWHEVMKFINCRIKTEWKKQRNWIEYKSRICRNRERNEDCVGFDWKSLYHSAMVDKDSYYARIETRYFFQIKNKIW